MTRYDDLEILLVEDNPGDARLIEKRLERADTSLFTSGFTVHHADDLRSGLDCLERCDIDVLLLDLGLPESNELETLGRALEEAHDIPIVVLTGLDDQETATDAITEGAQDYLTKDDLTGRELVRSIRYAIERKQRERELERHKAYVESTNDMLTLIVPDGTIEYVSPVVEQVLGYDLDDLIGEDGFAYVHPDDRSEQRDAIERLVQGPDEETVLEFRFQCADCYEASCTDEGYCWIEATARDRLEDPDIQGVLLSSREITERKEYEQQLSTLHDATRRFIDAGSKAEVADIAVDTANDLLGFSLPSVWFPTDDGTALELVANSEEHQQLLVDAGTPEPSHPRDNWLWEILEAGETVVKSPLPAEKLAADVPLHSAIVLPLGEHGILACAARGEVEFSDREVKIAEVLARNVQVALDQLDQQEALRQQKAFTDDLLDAIEDVVYVLDADGDLQRWNEALETVTGYTGEEISGMNAADFFADEDADKAAAAIEEAFETGRTRVELDFRTKEGEAIPYEFIANVFEDPDGEPVMAGSGRDRTIHVDYERTLQEQRDRLEILNQVVRHDIRNDLQLVQAYAGMLEGHLEDEQREYLEIIQESTEKAIDLTTTARDLADVMLQTDVENRRVALAPVLDQQVDEIRSTYPDVIVTVDSSMPGTHVVGNDMLGAVFRNLLKNAIQHNDKDVPEVSVSTEETEEYVTVHVADNGPGVPDAQKEEIFGKGEKGLESEGTGVGLYLVRSLVEDYGGDVWVEDNDPEGAIFTVKLPTA